MVQTLEQLGRGQGFGYAIAPGCGWQCVRDGPLHAGARVDRARIGTNFAFLFNETIRDPLGLDSVELATTREQFSRVCWGSAKRYSPGWVYHECLIGTARDAALLLHALFSGKLLNTDMLGQMLVRHPVGGTIEGRPWTDCGYSLGLMSGSTGSAGRAFGHSGGGPFCVNAVYHFPDKDHQITVASFTDGRDEGIAEFEVARRADTGSPRIVDASVEGVSRSDT